MTTTVTPDRLIPQLAASGTGIVVCLATGPSLTPEDVEACRGKATIVAVNDAHRFAPWADVLYSSDRYWWQHHRGVPSFEGIKATIEFSPGRKALDLQRLAAGMRFFRLTGHEGLETDPTGLRSCRQNSGGAALNLAVHLGPTRIVLLGYDMGYGLGGEKHFFGDHPRGLNALHNFPSWRVGFDLMAVQFRELGIEVLNCSRRTSLAAFPCVPLEEALR